MVGPSTRRCCFLLLLTARVWDSPLVEAVGPSTSSPERVRRPRGRPPPNRQGRNLVTRGTPTGGGKYPFLAVVLWDEYTEVPHPDPRDSNDIWCNGVMVARDVLLTSRYCRPNFGHVMVGDSGDRSSNAPVQFPRVQGDIYRDAVANEDGLYRLFRVDPVTFPGFVPVVVNNDTNSSNTQIGQNVTVVSYGPANSFIGYGYNNETWPGQALEGTLQISYVDWTDLWFFAGNDNGEGAGVCMADQMAPVLDSEMKLVALADDWSCGERSTELWKIAYYADFVERNTCAMSNYSHELSFCPDLICPTDARVMGYPFAELPNGTDMVKGIRGFEPTHVTQWPPPGTVIGQGSTPVTLTATDASNYILDCVWTVVVPQLEVVGQVEQDLPVGTYNSSTVANRANKGPYNGYVFKMKSVLSEGLQAEQKRTWVSYRMHPTRHNNNLDGEITMLPNETKAIKYFSDPIPISLVESILPNITVETELLKNLAPNNETVLLYGQVEYYQ